MKKGNPFISGKGYVICNMKINHLLDLKVRENGKISCKIDHYIFLVIAVYHNLLLSVSVGVGGPLIPKTSVMQ